MYLYRHTICWIKHITDSYSTPTGVDCSVIGHKCCSATGEMLASSDSVQAQSKFTGYILESKLEIKFPEKMLFPMSEILYSFPRGLVFIA